MVAASSHPLAAIHVSEAMHEGVISCGKQTLLSGVAGLMADHNVHCIVVVDDDDPRQPWGLISDLDLIAAASVRGLDGQTAGATAASPIVMVSPDETVERAAQLMTEHGVAHVIVADSETLRPLGVLSTLDIARLAATA